MSVSWTFVLRPDVEISQVAEIAERLGWQPAHVPAVAGRSPELGWSTPGGASVGLYSEPAFNCTYLDLVGPDLEQLSWDIGGFGVHITAPMVLGAARRAATDEDRVRIAGHIACVFPRGLSAAGVEQLRAWYEHGGDALRDAVLAAIEYRSWPEAVGLLARIQSDANAARAERDAHPLAGQGRPPRAPPAALRRDSAPDKIKP